MRSRDIWREMVDVELDLVLINDKTSNNDNRFKRSSRDSLCCTW